MAPPTQAKDKLVLVEGAVLTLRDVELTRVFRQTLMLIGGPPEVTVKVKVKVSGRGEGDRWAPSSRGEGDLERVER